METFREDIAKLGYKFQFYNDSFGFVTNTSMFELALAYKRRCGIFSDYKKRVCFTS